MTANKTAEGVDAVLGCPVALADATQLLDCANGVNKFSELPPGARHAACWAHKTCLDVVRDLVNVFVCDSNPEYRWKVVQRDKEREMQRSVFLILLLSSNMKTQILQQPLPYRNNNKNIMSCCHVSNV
jgi:hypothetical protein